MKRRRGFLADNKGSTLVEIIVSVLIIAIAFVPLMSGMASALKANTAAETKLFADNVAQKCMEIVKSADSKEAVPTAFSYDTSLTATGGVTTSVSGLKEGDREYTAEISYTSIASLNTEGDYTSIKGISGNNKASTNAAVKTDYDALEYFLSQYKHATTSTTPLDMLQFMGDKTTTVTLEYVTDTDDDDCGLYRLITKTQYTVRNSAKDKFDCDPKKVITSTLKYESIPDTVILFTSSMLRRTDGASAKEVADSLYSYCKDVKHLTLNAQSTYTSSPSIDETINIENKVATIPDKLSFYLLMTDVDVTKEYNNATHKAQDGGYGSNIKVKFSNANAAANASKQYIYCPLNVNDVGSDHNYTFIPSLFETASTAEIPKIYTVVVKVTDTVTGEVESELTSTVVFKK